MMIDRRNTAPRVAIIGAKLHVQRAQNAQRTRGEHQRKRSPHKRNGSFRGGRVGRARGAHRGTLTGTFVFQKYPTTIFVVRFGARCALATRKCAAQSEAHVVCDARARSVQCANTQKIKNGSYRFKVDTDQFRYLIVKRRNAKVS